MIRRSAGPGPGPGAPSSAKCETDAHGSASAGISGVGGPSLSSASVDASGDVWVAAEVLRDEFVHSQKDVDAVETTSDLEDASQATVELFARFLAFVADNLSTNDRLAEARTEVLLFAIQAFTDAYLTTNDVHSLTTSYDADVRKTVLSSYFRALAVLEERQVSGIPRCPPSALLSASDEGSISAYALFGGQGTNEVYFDELQKRIVSSRHR